MRSMRRARVLTGLGTSHTVGSFFLGLLTSMTIFSRQQHSSASQYNCTSCKVRSINWSGSMRPNEYVFSVVPTIRSARWRLSRAASSGASKCTSSRICTRSNSTKRPPRAFSWSAFDSTPSLPSVYPARRICSKLCMPILCGASSARSVSVPSTLAVRLDSWRQILSQMEGGSAANDWFWAMASRTHVSSAVVSTAPPENARM